VGSEKARKISMTPTATLCGANQFTQTGNA
jgi:hypothetical protein